MDSRALWVAVAGEDHAHRVLAQTLSRAVLCERGENPETLSWWPPGQNTGLSGEEAGYYKLHRIEHDLRSLLPGRKFRLRRVQGKPAEGAGPFLDMIQLLLAM